MAGRQAFEAFDVRIRVAEVPCGAGGAFLHPACAAGLSGVEFHDCTVGELMAAGVVYCDGCGERIVPRVTAEDVAGLGGGDADETGVQ